MNKVYGLAFPTFLISTIALTFTASAGFILDAVKRNGTASVLPALSAAQDQTVLLVKPGTAVASFLLISLKNPVGTFVAIEPGLLDTTDTSWYRESDPEFEDTKDNYAFDRLKRWPRVSSSTVPLAESFARVAKLVDESEREGRMIRDLHVGADGIVMRTAPPQALQDIVSIFIERKNGVKWQTIAIDFIPVGLSAEITPGLSSLRVFWDAQPTDAKHFIALNPESGAFVADRKIQPGDRPVLTAQEVRGAIDEAQTKAAIDRPPASNPENDSLLAAAFKLEIYRWSEEVSTTGAPSVVAPSNPKGIRAVFLALGLHQHPSAYRQALP